MSLKEYFNSLGRNEYSFENGTKKAQVSTRKGILSSSYKITYSDSAEGLQGENTRLTVLSDCTGQGVKKAKEYCGLN